MAYKEEYKIEILEKIKTKTVKEISQETGISKTTLYNWIKKQKEQTKTVNMKSKEKEELDQKEKQENNCILGNKDNVINENVLEKIRIKIYKGTIDNKDIEEFREKMQFLEKTQYYLIQIAMYERIGQKNNALRIIKQMEEEGISLKELNSIKQRLKSKKQSIYDFGKWDELIEWNTSKKNRNKPKQKTEPKQKSESKTIFSTLNDPLKEVVKEIKSKYYKKIKLKITKYDSYRQKRYVDKLRKLQSILSCSSNNQRARMELIFILINEGYREIVKQQIPTEDYQYIDRLIKETFEKKAKEKNMKKQIDEDCR